MDQQSSKPNVGSPDLTVPVASNTNQSSPAPRSKWHEVPAELKELIFEQSILQEKVIAEAKWPKVLGTNIIMVPEEAAKGCCIHLAQSLGLRASTLDLKRFKSITAGQVVYFVPDFYQLQARPTRYWEAESRLGLKEPDCKLLPANFLVSGSDTVTALAINLDVYQIAGPEIFTYGGSDQIPDLVDFLLRFQNLKSLSICLERQMGPPGEPSALRFVKGSSFFKTTSGFRKDELVRSFSDAGKLKRWIKEEISQRLKEAKAGSGLELFEKLKFDFVMWADTEERWAKFGF